MTILLDTHVLIYWFSQDQRLSQVQLDIIEQASPEEPLWIAGISLWEIATLHSLGRIKLQLPLRDWLEAASASAGATP